MQELRELIGDEDKYALPTMCLMAARTQFYPSESLLLRTNFPRFLTILFRMPLCHPRFLSGFPHAFISHVSRRRPCRNGQTALHWAATYGHASALTLLIKLSALADAKDKYGHATVRCVGKLCAAGIGPDRRVAQRAAVGALPCTMR